MYAARCMSCTYHVAVQIRTLSAADCILLVRAAFERLLSPYCEHTVDITGQAALRATLLCKLATSPLTCITSAEYAPVQPTMLMIGYEKEMKEKENKGEEGDDEGDDEEKKQSDDMNDDDVAPPSPSLTLHHSLPPTLMDAPTPNPAHLQMIGYILRDIPTRYEVAVRWIITLLVQAKQEYARDRAVKLEMDEEDEQHEEKEQKMKQEQDGATTNASDTSSTSTAVAVLPDHPSPTLYPPHGTPAYTHAVACLIRGMESLPPPHDKLYSYFVLDVPILTDAVYESIESMCTSVMEEDATATRAKITVGLQALRDLVMQRLPARKLT